VGTHECANPIAAYVQTVAAAAGADVLWGFYHTPDSSRPGNLTGTLERPAEDRWDGTADRYSMGRQPHWGTPRMSLPSQRQPCWSVSWRLLVAKAIFPTKGHKNRF
jgi:hypothetical protein